MTSTGSTGKTQRQNGNRHSKRFPLLRDQRKGTRCETKQRKSYFFYSEGFVHHDYTHDDKRLTKDSTWRSCEVCMNQFAENDRQSGGMATGSCTTTMRPHTLHTLCSRFRPNTTPLGCRSHHTHQISHRVTFSYSQGLRKFWKVTDLRQGRTSNEIWRRHY